MEEKGKLEQIPGYPVWIVDGGPVSFFGFTYPTRMTLIRLSGDRLWVHSPICLDDDLRARIEALGKVTYLVSPNKLHHLFLSAWKERYPEADVYASPGLRRHRRNYILITISVSFRHRIGLTKSTKSSFTAVGLWKKWLSFIVLPVP